MKTPEVSLPDYERPPVIEVACGIQFVPLTRFQATALGLFWQTIRDEYTEVQEMAPLPQIIEQLSSVSEPTDAKIEMFGIPPLPRMFFLHKESCWLMQVQRDRFLHNWLKERDEYSYPHYPLIYERFWKAWERFLLFCNDEKIESPVVNQLEITYINHIPVGQGWETLADLGNVFRDIGWIGSDRFLPPPESAGLRLTFLLPDSQGRLHVSVKHAVRVSDKQPVLLCELTARGLPDKKDVTAIKNWFGLGREWIVRGFADIMNIDVQKEQWGRKV